MHSVGLMLRIRHEWSQGTQCLSSSRPATGKIGSCAVGSLCASQIQHFSSKEARSGAGNRLRRLTHVLLDGRAGSSWCSSGNEAVEIRCQKPTQKDQMQESGCIDCTQGKRDAYERWLASRAKTRSREVGSGSRHRNAVIGLAGADGDGREGQEDKAV